MSQFRITLPPASDKPGRPRIDKPDTQSEPDAQAANTLRARSHPHRTIPETVEGQAEKISPKSPVGAQQMPDQTPQSMALMQREEAQIIWRQSARDSYEFMPALLEVMDRPASPAGRMLVYIIATFFTGLVLWATFGRVDIVAVAPGTIQPVGGEIVVQAGAAGTVTQLRVAVGDTVTQGDILFTLDDREAFIPRSQIEERLQRHAMTARINARLLTMMGAPVTDRLSDITLPENLAELVETQARARLSTHQADLGALDAEIAEIETRMGVTAAEMADREEALELYRAHEANFASLAARGLARQAEWLEIQIMLDQQEATLLTERGELTNMAAQLNTLAAGRSSKIEAARYSAVEAFLEAQQSGSIALFELERLDTSGERLTVRAPRDGTISRLDVSVGATIPQAGVAVAALLPDENLIVEAQLPSRDIGFVALGMEVAIKVDAYPYTRFGHLSGTITAISPTSVTTNASTPPSYEVTVALDDDALQVEGNTYPISSGMQVTADIKTGDRSILDYFLSPITASVSETLRER